MFDLAGQAALVTGASGGIGGAIATALHAQGAMVTLAGTARRGAGELAAELGERADVATADLADPAAADAPDRRRPRPRRAGSTSWSTTPASPATSSRCG